MDKISVLFASDVNWNKKYPMPAYIVLTEISDALESEQEHFDVAIIDRTLSDAECWILSQRIFPYCLFRTERTEMSQEMSRLFTDLCEETVPSEKIPDFLQHEAKYFFEKSYGERYQHKNLEVFPFFQGEVSREGNCGCVLKGSFGKDFRQIAYWKNTIPVAAERELDFYLEYETEGTVEIRMTLTRVAQGARQGEIPVPLVYEESEIREGVHLGGVPRDCMLFVSLEAKGNGMLRIIALHDRYSRGSHGVFLPGGERFVTSRREEIFTYFESGNRKPPLNVYFSGYRTQEGFEGVQMMRSLGHPFLILSECRLSGGGMYMGDEEFESIVQKRIEWHCRQLGFSEKELILSGIGFGSVGALYYGSRIIPGGIILGKPILHPGRMAENERLLRPGRFPQALDLLLYQERNLNPQAVHQLDQRVLPFLEKADFSHTLFRAGYMKDDDYDPQAYGDLSGMLEKQGITLMERGFMGRHNDNNRAILARFQESYQEVMEELRESWGEYD